MATMNIISIKGTPELSTSNVLDVTLQPGVETDIWTPAGYYNDKDGSLKPITFRTPASISQPYIPKIKVDTVIVFTPQFAGQTYVVEAWLNPGDGNLIKVFEQDGNVAPAPIPSPSVTVPIMFSDLKFSPSLNLMNSSPVPFRVSGDFTWKLKFQNQPDITSLLATRLEICYARVVAPSGPSTTTKPSVTQTAVDLKGIYPIRLLRLFAPSPAEFTAVPNFNQSNVYGSWFAQRIMRKVWSWGNPQAPGKIQYDALSGGAKYGVNAFGGSFALTGWYDSVVPYCNCYDLAGIAQLGCSVLMSTMGAELFDSHWLFQIPNGYIKQCDLYGWSGLYPYNPNLNQKGVNNPFFLANTPTNPYVPPGGANRDPFGNHAWVEILRDPMNSGSRVVLDATTAVWDATANVCVPDCGTRSRIEYKDAHVDVNADTTPGHVKTGNLEAYTKASLPSDGDCVLNYTYWTGNQPGVYGRVGVRDADGIVNSKIATSLLGLLDEKVLAEIDILLKKGRNTSSNPVGLVNAELGVNLLGPITGISGELRPRDPQIKVVDSLSRLTLTFDGARFSESVSARLEIHIHVFDSDLSARSALIHGLLSYAPSGRLSDAFDSLQTPLAETALIDRAGTNLYFVRGNCFVHLSVIPERLCAPDPTLQSLEAIASVLDSHLVSDTLPPGTGFRSDYELETPDNSEIRIGNAVTLYASGEIAIVSGSSSNTKSIICAGPKDGRANTIEFFAVADGESELCLHIANERTLYPTTKRWSVVVRD